MNNTSTDRNDVSDLNLWIKVKTSDSLTLADVPSLIKLRIRDIVQSWEEIKDRILTKQSGSQDPGRLNIELNKFDNLVKLVRVRPDALGPISETEMISKYYTVFDSMDVYDMSVSEQESAIIEREVKRVSSFTIDYFKFMRSNIIKNRDNLADSIGGQDQTYNSVFNRSSVSKTLDRTIQRISMCAQYQVAINTITDIILNSDQATGSLAKIDPFAFARANANNPDFDIQSYKSGKMFKLNYGESLETLALRTMGDQSKWIEIAIANGLKPPYIDEVGEKIKLIANGNNNTINIGRSDGGGRLNIEKVYINQIVILQSDTRRPPDQRTIKSIKEIPVSGEIVIELDGEPNLNTYKAVDNATMRVFKPNTINSNFYVLIPNKDTPINPMQKETPWFLKSKGKDEQNALVDIFLDKNNDLSFTPYGDLQLSYGVDNGMQALKILISTVKGSRPLHPNYGVLDIVGTKSADRVAESQSISQSISEQILNDPRFDRLEFMTVESIKRSSSGGPVGYVVKVGVVLAGGGNNVIPISFEIDSSNA